MSKAVTYILSTYGDIKPDEEVVSKTGLLLIDGDVINYMRPVTKDKILVNVKRNADWYKSKDDSIILKSVTFNSRPTIETPTTEEAPEPTE